MMIVCDHDADHFCSSLFGFGRFLQPAQPDKVGPVNAR
jgi:hypothetical protein